MPQNKKYKKLTPLEELFCLEYIKDWNASRSVLAAGYNTKNPTQMATCIIKRPQIQRRLDELTKDRKDRLKIDADYVIHELVAIIEKTKADDAFNPTAALRGLELLARHLGMFIERQEITGKDGQAIQLEKIQNDADAFARTIARLASRSGEGELPVFTITGSEGSS